MAKEDDDVKDIKTSLKDVGDQLKTFAESSQREIKAAAKMSEDTRASVDKLLTQQGELQARLSTAEQIVAKLEQGGGGGDVGPKSMGEQLTHAEGYEKFASRASRNDKFSIPVQAGETFVVSLKFFNANANDLFAGTVVSDASGCQTGKNAVRS